MATVVGPGPGEEPTALRVALPLGGTCRCPTQLTFPTARAINPSHVDRARSPWMKPSTCDTAYFGGIDRQHVNMIGHHALRQQQAGAGDIVLLYGDESEALRIPISPASGPRQGRICVFPHRDRRRRSRCWVRSIPSRVGSSCRPARPSAAPTTSPISINDQHDQLQSQVGGLVLDSSLHANSRRSSFRADWLLRRVAAQYAPD